MSDRPTPPTLDELREIARAIVNHKGTRGAIGVSVTAVLGLAHAFCALDEVARSSAEMLAAGERMYRAGKAGDFGAEHAADDDRDHHENELTVGLMALGYLTLITTTEKDATHG